MPGLSIFCWLLSAGAISYRRVLRTENERFRAVKLGINLQDPQLVIFFRHCFWTSVSGRHPTGNRARAHQLPRPKLAAWSWVSIHRARQQASEDAESSSTEGPHLSAMQATGLVLLAVSRYPPPLASQASRADGIGL